MQGSVNRQEKWRRSRDAATLVGGYLVGAGLFGALAYLLGRPIQPLLTHGQRSAVVVGVMLIAGVGDVVAVVSGRLHPLGLRRQAVQTLTYRWRHGSAVGFMWGLDAGFGAGTYRVTSGLWVLAAATFTSTVGPWAAMVYGGGFAAGFLAVVAWPVRPRVGESPSNAASARILRTARLRPVGQLAYLVILPLAVAALAWGAWW